MTLFTWRKRGQKVPSRTQDGPAHTGNKGIALPVAYTYITLYIIQCVLSAIGSVVPTGPQCDQTADCVGKATCDANNKVCVCDDFFVMSGDWTECLPGE
jgi:hypothetical protein